MLTCNASVQAITIDLLPAFQEVDVNTPVKVDITISGLIEGTAPSLGAYDLNIVYDPNMLSFSGSSSMSFGDQLDLFGFGSVRMVDDSVAGIINLYEVSFDLVDDLNQLQLSSFTLATLTFAPLIDGMSTLDAIVNALGDANGDPLETEVNAAQVRVTSTHSIPEPMTLLLFVTGLAGLRWQKSAQKG
jgi:hypothetical protein